MFFSFIEGDTFIWNDAIYVKYAKFLKEYKIENVVLINPDWLISYIDTNQRIVMHSLVLCLFEHYLKIMFLEL